MQYLLLKADGSTHNSSEQFVDRDERGHWNPITRLKLFDEQARSACRPIRISSRMKLYSSRSGSQRPQRSARPRVAGCRHGRPSTSGSTTPAVSDGSAVVWMAPGGLFVGR